MFGKVGEEIEQKALFEFNEEERKKSLYAIVNKAWQ
jgi:hypothetical protein